MSIGAAPSFPAASGRRMLRAEMPGPVRSAIEDRLGARVVTARSQAGGFSPGVAARLELADGTRVFVKAVCSVPNPDSPGIHRREARIAAALPAEVPAPPLLWSWDDGEWVVLAFDDVDGRAPLLPWRADELERVFAAVSALADALTPSPIALEPARAALDRLFGGWRRLADDGDRDGEGDAPSVPTALRGRIDDLVALESRWPESVPGDTLVHLDLRADNILLTPDRVLVVDWPWAGVGAPWLDLIVMLPSIAMQGGPAPEEIWRAHPLSRGVDDDQVDAFVAALAGFFVHASRLPPAPGLPTLRPFQAAQAEQAVAWLARRRGWNA